MFSEPPWDELLERGLVRETTFDQYSLTGSGWIAGLKVPANLTIRFLGKKLANFREP